MASPKEREIIERIEAAIQAQIGGLKKIEVPLFGTDPIEIWFRAMTLAEQGRILKLMEKNTADALATVLIMRARTADGEPMFSAASRNVWLHKPGMEKFVNAAVNAMTEADAEDNVEGAPDAGN